MIYGEEFNKYYKESIEFFHEEQKKEPWITAAVLVQATLVLLGLFFVPSAYMSIWLTTVIIGLLITLYNTIRIWFKQRRYSSFENWRKYARDRN